MRCIFIITNHNIEKGETDLCMVNKGLVQFLRWNGISNVTVSVSGILFHSHYYLQARRIIARKIHNPSNSCQRDYQHNVIIMKMVKRVGVQFAELKFLIL